MAVTRQAEAVSNSLKQLNGVRNVLKRAKSPSRTPPAIGLKETIASWLPAEDQFRQTIRQLGVANSLPGRSLRGHLPLPYLLGLFFQPRPRNANSAAEPARRQLVFSDQSVNHRFRKVKEFRCFRRRSKSVCVVVHAVWRGHVP
jgi:hypothetical protein